MTETLYVIIGLIIGSVIMWFIARRTQSTLQTNLKDSEHRATTAEAVLPERQRQIEELSHKVDALQTDLTRESQARVKADAEKAELDKRLDEERKLLAEAEKKLSDTFSALAKTTLDSNTQAFLALAKSTFTNLMVEAKGDLGKREEAIKGLIAPLADSLHKFETHVQGLEKSRLESYTSLNTQIKSLVGTHQQLQKETTNLVTALKTPQVRGRWGEITLKRVAELSGMSEHCDFTEQVNVSTESGRLRPDLVVHLPADRDIVVDAKVALDAYLEFVSATSDQQRQSTLVRHAKQMRTHMETLAAKNYWQQFKKTPEFVVMFIPGESFFGAAVDVDHALIEDGLKNGVVLSTPTTLIALLRAVAYGWRQERIAENAQAVGELGRQLYERMKTLAEYIDSIGSGLKSATEAYNKAIGSIESRILPSARKFRELGTTTAPEIPQIEPIDLELRKLDVPERHEANTPKVAE
jgi:DNA recombination protein RmuC